MEIFIDESGSFVVNGANSGSWCLVAAYVSPEAEKKKYQVVLRELKRKEGKASSSEIKLHEVQEDNYFCFLEMLAKLKGILLCSATDSYFNHESLVIKHQRNQAIAIRDNIDEMIYESGKRAVQKIASQLENLSPQLYIQLVIQIQLMLSFIHKGISYFVQRYPSTLKSFRWRIDQKNPNIKTAFEDAFEKFGPALLQTFSLFEPAPRLSWCNYRHMNDFLFNSGELPKYLTKKLPHLKDKAGFDIGKIARKDIKFIDSEASTGVQIADLLASGVRRLLRVGFNNNDVAAQLLGRTMVQGENNQSPIKLLTFGKEIAIKDELSKLVKIMTRYCRPMVK
jgi:hypothetical protein